MGRTRIPQHGSAATDIISTLEMVVSELVKQILLQSILFRGNLGRAVAFVRVALFRTLDALLAVINVEAVGSLFRFEPS